MEWLIRILFIVFGIIGLFLSSKYKGHSKRVFIQTMWTFFFIFYFFIKSILSIFWNINIDRIKGIGENIALFIFIILCLGTVPSIMMNYFEKIRNRKKDNP